MNRKLALFFILLALTSFACTVELVTPQPTALSANSSPTAVGSATDQYTAIAIPANSSPTSIPTVGKQDLMVLAVGVVVADDAVKVRDTPEANGVQSNGVGALYKGQPVQQVGECVTVGTAVWVHHSAGWSVARNGSGVYIVGVCD